jgi:hypothetical protein
MNNAPSVLRADVHACHVLQSQCALRALADSRGIEVWHMPPDAGSPRRAPGHAVPSPALRRFVAACHASSGGRLCIQCLATPNF